jgi:vWA-MoxR associated protein C-terminal domain/vWA-MoxR associated protein middle region 0/Caspase domain
VTVRPADTLALVVGVERYDAGEKWGLDGPALDACRFATWLTGRGVPSDRVTLLVSPLAENEAAVARASQSFRVGAADMATVRDAVTKDLYDSSSGLLVIYWGGHGVFGETDARHLFYADATVTDKRNLDLTALLRALQTDTYPRHPRQLVLVDACLSLAAKMRWRTTVPGGSFPSGGLERGRDQRALFAASPGEQAINNDRLKSGLFSQIILEALDPLPAGDWPPDADKLRDTVNERFHELREAGRTRQTPSHFWYQSRSDEETLVFSSRPARGRLTAASLGCQVLSFAEHRELKKILHGAPAPTSLRALYRQAARSVVGLPRHADDLMSCIEVLRDALSSMPLFEFLVRFAACSDSVTQERLWAWVRDTAERYDDIDLDALESLNNELRRTVLLVRVEPDLIETGDRVTIWTYVGSVGQQAVAADTPWTREWLAGELNRLLAEVDPELDGTATTVEFLVGLDMLDDDFESLPIRVAGTDHALGLTLPVVVRSLDRLTDPALCQLWQDKWKLLAACWDSYDEDAICWIDHALGTGDVDLVDLGDHVCAALAYGRPARADEDPALHAVLKTGTPVAVWHRSSGSRLARRTALEQVLRGRALHELPDVVLHQRVAARHPAAEAEHAGRDLVLLWDDPSRVPSDMLWQPPAQEGAVP